MHFLTLLHNLLSCGVSICLVCLFFTYFKLFSYLFAFQKLTGFSFSSTSSPSMDSYPFTFQQTKANTKTYKYKLYNADRPVSVKHAINLMYNSKEFRSLFVKELRDVSFEAYFFEMPPVTADDFESKDFEFVLVDSPVLAGNTNADTKTFQEHFTSECTVVTFPNISNDATLIAPCPLHDNSKTNLSHYTHLASFLRHGNEMQVEELWRRVASAVSQRVREGGGNRFWVSTSGLGVDWLHMRLDSRPKYYTFTEYIK